MFLLRSLLRAPASRGETSIASLKAQNHESDPPAWAAAAAIATSPQRRPRLPQKLPSDISTLQSNGHLNLVATHAAVSVKRTCTGFAMSTLGDTETCILTKHCSMCVVAHTSISH